MAAFYTTQLITAHRHLTNSIVKQTLVKEMKWSVSKVDKALFMIKYMFSHFSRGVELCNVAKFLVYIRGKV